MSGKIFPIIDDIGSFPLPSYIYKKRFDNFYWDAFQGLINGYDIFANDGIKTNIINPINTIFEMKCNSGIEIANYPQLMDMYTQFIKPIQDYEIKSEPNKIDPDKAKILEVEILKNWAKLRYEDTGEQYNLKICVTGPLDLYFKKIGFSVYPDMALNFSKSVNSFIKNSIVNTEYLKTKLVSIDEPSLGYVSISGAEKEDLIKIYDKSAENINCDVQIHLHSLNSFRIPLETKNINVLTCEFASNQKNVIDKSFLDEFDKQMRVGICQTSFNAIMAQKMEEGINYSQFDSIEGLRLLIDSPQKIKHNLKLAIKQYGDRLKYVGPDCGLNAWAPPELATELLSRTADVVKKFRNQKQ